MAHIANRPDVTYLRNRELVAIPDAEAAHVA
jgi:hypothetical protein